ncbi:MAG: peptidoglycan editing factor PgeF [Colwelliaceae bacterium]|nr:peptidoglycan editing factor PgeF [Colwelliaceae bacterium]
MSSLNINQQPIKENQAFDLIDMPVNKIQAFQTTRINPNNNDIQPSKNKSLSPVAFEHFNLGLHVGDNEKSVLNNRQKLLSYLPNNTNIQWLEQVHGNSVIVVNEQSTTAIKADAIITRASKLALAIMTADCLPILLVNADGTEIAAIHAGWRPLASGIIEETLSKIYSNNQDIYAWLGPCISQRNFEVGNEVKTKFEKLNPQFSVAFKINKKGKWLADLQQIAIMMLQELGVENITTSNGCTFDNNERYYSYRKEQKTGRMVTIICIE